MAHRDTLIYELDNPDAIQAMMERYNVDESTAREMWHLFIETAQQLRDKAKAKGTI